MNLLECEKHGRRCLFNVFNIIKSAINKYVEKQGRSRSQIWWEKDRELTVVDLDTVTRELGPSPWGLVSNDCSQGHTVGMTMTSFKGSLVWPVNPPSRDGDIVMLFDSIKP